MQFHFCGLSLLLLSKRGGYIGNNNFGFDYIKGLFTTLFGVDDISFFSAEGLDIFGNDSEKILSEAIEKMYLVINQEKLRYGCEKSFSPD